MYRVVPRLGTSLKLKLRLKWIDWIKDADTLDNSKSFLDPIGSYRIALKQNCPYPITRDDVYSQTFTLSSKEHS